MTTDQKDSLKLHHIIDATQHLLDFTNGVSKGDFVVDYEKQSAVIRQLEVIGEAASNLTTRFTQQHREIDWPKVIGMRHKMIHDYFDVDVDIVWTTAVDDVPPLKVAVEKILNYY